MYLAVQTNDVMINFLWTESAKSFFKRLERYKERNIY